MAASFFQIKNICAQSFCLFVLTINRILALSVFKKTKGTGSAYNKALKTTPFGRSDAFTRGGFAIMPHATAPLSLMLCISENPVTDSEIKFFLQLKKQVNERPNLILLVIIFLAANGLIGFVPFLGQGFSVGMALALSFNFLQAKFRVGNIAQCVDLIEKLINKDAELIKRVNEHKNA